MMLRADPSIHLLAAALPNADWTLPLLREAGRYLSYVSVHQYWERLAETNAPSDYATCMMFTEGPERLIRTTESIIEVAGLRGNVAIAFDEWNLRGWHHPSLNGALFADVASRDKNDINATYTMADALFSACFLNACLRHCQSVQMACMAPVVNARGPLFVHSKGIVKRTTFHVLAMYANLLERNVASAWIDSDPFVHGGKSVPSLDAVVTCDDAMKKWRLALVNRHPELDLACTLTFGDVGLGNRCAMTVLSGDSPDAYNDVDAPGRVAPVKVQQQLTNDVISLPPHSVMILELA